MGLLTQEDAHPFALFLYLTKKYGHEWMDWAPSVLRTTLERDGEPISRNNLYRAMAAGAVAVRDEFWHHWEAFHFLCQAFNGIPPTADEMQEHTVGQMMVAVDAATHIRESLGKMVSTPSFSPEVSHYVGAQAQGQGVWLLPPPLDFAQADASKPYYHCNDCGNEQEILFPDSVVCDVCTNRLSTESLKDWKPDPEALKRGLGRNIKILEKNPTAGVGKLLKEALESSSPTLPETSDGACVSRLLVALAELHAAEKARIEAVGGTKEANLAALGKAAPAAGRALTKVKDWLKWIPEQAAGGLKETGSTLHGLVTNPKAALKKGVESLKELPWYGKAMVAGGTYLGTKNTLEDPNMGKGEKALRIGANLAGTVALAPAGMIASTLIGMPAENLAGKVGRVGDSAVRKVTGAAPPKPPAPPDAPEPPQPARLLPPGGRSR